MKRERLGGGGGGEEGGRERERIKETPLKKTPHNHTHRAREKKQPPLYSTTVIILSV